MNRVLLLTTAALIGSALLSPCAQAQQKVDELGVTITTTPTLATDYRFRGISQMQRDPALQLSLDIEHDSGLYIGGFVSTVDFGNDSRLETDALLGYRFELAGISFDLGGIYYGYPGYTEPEGGYRQDFWELAARATREFEPVTLTVGLNYSPDFFFESGQSVYLEGGADIALPFEFTLSGRLGHQWIERNERFGTPDYLTWTVGLSRDLFGFTFSVSYIGTDLSKRECFGGSNLCGDTVLASVSRTF